MPWIKSYYYYYYYYYYHAYLRFFVTHAALEFETLALNNVLPLRVTVKADGITRVP